MSVDNDANVTQATEWLTWRSYEKKKLKSLLAAWRVEGPPQDTEQLNNMHYAPYYDPFTVYTAIVTNRESIFHNHDERLGDINRPLEITTLWVWNKSKLCWPANEHKTAVSFVDKNGGIETKAETQKHKKSLKDVRMQPVDYGKTVSA